jgi:hypothetical protein
LESPVRGEQMPVRHWGTFHNCKWVKLAPNVHQMDKETILAYLDYCRQGRQHLYDLRKWREPEEGMARSRSAKTIQLIII